jgi:phospholipase C
MNPEAAIKHVVLLMMENHSFDQMLGSLQGVYPELDGVDIDAPEPRFNVDLSGSRVFQIPTDEQQVARDPMHETVSVLAQLEDGNGGFVRDYQAHVRGTTTRDRQNVMGYYALDRLPALHQLARDFTVCDRWFSSLPGPTWPNRFFALSGTSCGRVLMPLGLRAPRLGEFTSQTQDTLFDRLNEAGRSWKVYYYDFPISLLFEHQRRPENLQRYDLIKHFFQEARNEKEFPEFTLIEPKYMGADQNDDHPPHNVFKAEKLIADVYNAIRGNPALWESTLLVVTYDEHGGFYDHVAPPNTVPPDEHQEEWTFDRLGVRVPTILVSPWAPRGVEKTQFDSTSLLRYLTDRWRLGPLGRRAAAAQSIAVALKQSELRTDTVPFIRVPYTNLIPADASLERRDDSVHHRAIYAFAAFLAQEKGVATGALIEDLARAAGWWTGAKAQLGRLLGSISRRLAGASDEVMSAKESAASEVARRVIVGR